MIKRILLLFLVLGLFTHCSDSVIYSPAVNLPVKPLLKNEFDLQGGIGLLPEARPHMLGGSYTTFAAIGQLSYGFSDKFSLNVKGWTDIEQRENSLRAGAALTAQFALPLNSKSWLLFLPRVGIATGGLGGGTGFGLSTIYQKQIKPGLSYYAGIGSLVGLEEGFETDEGIKYASGIGLLGHAGVSWKFAGDFWLNCELTPIYQINHFENKKQFIVSPSLSIAYTFKND